MQLEEMLGSVPTATAAFIYALAPLFAALAMYGHAQHKRMFSVISGLVSIAIGCFALLVVGDRFLNEQWSVISFLVVIFAGLVSVIVILCPNALSR